MAKAQLTQDEIQAWAYDIGAKYSLDQNFAKYQVYQGTTLTPENSDEAEIAYLAEIEKRRSKWGKGDESFIRRLCQEDLYYHCKYLLLYDKLEYYFHWPMCQFEQEEVDRAGSRTLIQMQRASCKTTIFTIGGASRDIIRNPNIRIALWSHEEQHAGSKLEEMKLKQIRSPMFQRFFPEFIPKLKRDMQGKFHWNTPARTTDWQECTMEASGIMGGKEGFHHDKIVLDDTWSARSVTSQKVIDATKRRVADVDNMLISSDSRICAPCTRWGHNDPSELLRDNPDYVQLIASAINKEGESIYLPVPGHKGGLGDPLRKLYLQWVADEYHWFCQKQNNPQSTTSGFDALWFKPLSVNKVYEQWYAGEISCRVILLTDLASTEGASSNYNAAIVLIVDNLGRKIIAAAYRRRMTTLAATQMMFSLCDRWKVQLAVRQKAPLETTTRCPATRCTS